MKRIIGIAGPSGSGKSTLADKWAQEVGAGDVLSFDSYYHSMREGEGVHSKNFDHPDALDHELFCKHLSALKRGAAVSVPVYDFTRHARVGWQPLNVDGPVVFVEGILLLHFPEVRALLDSSVFLDVPFELCVERRIKRDCAERGRSEERVLHQIKTTVEPMYQKYVKKSCVFATYVFEESDIGPMSLIGL